MKLVSESNFQGGKIHHDGAVVCAGPQRQQSSQPAHAMASLLPVPADEGHGGCLRLGGAAWLGLWGGRAMRFGGVWPGSVVHCLTSKLLPPCLQKTSHATAQPEVCICSGCASTLPKTKKLQKISAPLAAPHLRAAFVGTSPRSMGFGARAVHVAVVVDPARHGLHRLTIPLRSLSCADLPCRGAQGPPTAQFDAADGLAEVPSMQVRHCLRSGGWRRLLVQWVVNCCAQRADRATPVCRCCRIGTRSCS